MLAQKAKQAGYSWLALELDDYGNLPRWPAFRRACISHGIVPGIWVTEGGNLFMAPDDTQFCIAELESESDYQGLLTVCAQLSELPPVWRAVITNYTPLTDAQGVPLPDRAAPLIDAGFRCITEAYLGDNPHATPDRLHFTATQKLGWPTSSPAFGRYNAPASVYEQWKDWPGCSDYLVENVLA